MRDQDDVPDVVIEREGGGGVGSFILGALVGAGLALLFAPQSGEETQEELKARALKLKGTAQDRFRPRCGRTSTSRRARRRTRCGPSCPAWSRKISTSP